MKVKIIDEKIQESIDELVHKVYERGYDDGYKVIPSVYQDNYEKGMSKIWEYIKKLGKLTIADMCEIFGEGYDNIYLIAYAYTPSEFIAKINEYEEKQIKDCHTCKWDYLHFKKYLNVSEDEKVRHCNECYKNSGYESMSTEMKSCSILEDDCPYDIKCEECEVHCSIERAREKLKEGK